MVSSCLISKSYCPYTNFFEILPSAHILIGITITFIFNSFFCCLVRSIYLSLFSSFSNYTQWPAGMAKFTIQQIFLLTIRRFGRLAEIRWSVCISKPERTFCCLLPDGFWFVHLPLVCMVKFKLLAQFPKDYLAHPVVSSLIIFLS